MKIKIGTQFVFFLRQFFLFVCFFLYLEEKQRNVILMGDFFWLLFWFLMNELTGEKKTVDILVNGRSFEHYYAELVVVIQ